MPQIDSAPLTAAHGYFWTGDYTGGSAATEPTLSQLATFVSAGTTPTNWDGLGHTSQENLLTPGQDGGEITTSGSWQKDTLRTSQSAVVETLVVPSIQLLDNKILTYYYGGGDYTTPGRFVGTANPAPIERRLALVLVDGDGAVACLYWPKASISRADAWSVDRSNPTELPLQFTRLDQSGQPPFVWISSALGTPA